MVEKMTEDKQQEQLEAVRKYAAQLLADGKYKDSAEAWGRLYELMPHDDDAALNLAASLIMTKKFKKAVEVLEPLAERTPDNAMLWTNLGAARLGNPVLAKRVEQEHAIDAFKNALGINPMAPHVAYNIGLIYKDMKDFGEALKWFKKARKTNPGDRDARLWAERMAELIK